MTDESTYGGLFQDPTYISSDVDPKRSDPYDKQDCIPSRYLGKNMMTGGATCPGQHPDSYIDKEYRTLASDEQNAAVYAINDKRERRHAAEEAKRKTKPVSDSEFRYSSYPAQSTGPGSYYGCFQSRPFEHDVDPLANATRQEKKAAQKREKAAAAAAEEQRRVQGLPNIKTSPGKKGTYGVPGVLLSKETYNDNWRADLEADEKKRRKAAAAAPEPKVMGGPFKVTGVCRTYIDELPATGAPAVYNAYEAPEETGARRGRKGKRGKQAAAEPQSIHDKAFCAGNLKGGQQGCINSFPNTWYDPREEEALNKKGKRRARKQAAEAAVPTRPKGADEWKPNSFGHTSVISSCLRRFY